MCTLIHIMHIGNVRKSYAETKKERKKRGVGNILQPKRRNCMVFQTAEILGDCWQRSSDRGSHENNDSKTEKKRAKNFNEYEKSVNYGRVGSSRKHWKHSRQEWEIGISLYGMRRTCTNLCAGPPPKKHDGAGSAARISYGDESSSCLCEFAKSTTIQCTCMWQNMRKGEKGNIVHGVWNKSEFYRGRIYYRKAVNQRGYIGKPR